MAKIKFDTPLPEKKNEPLRLTLKEFWDAKRDHSKGAFEDAASKQEIVATPLTERPTDGKVH